MTTSLTSQQHQESLVEIAMEGGLKVLDTSLNDRKEDGLERSWCGGKLVSEIEWRGGERHGLCKKYKDGCLRREDSYENGVRHGLCRTYKRRPWLQEAPWLAREAVYSNGKKNGRCKIYQAPGVLRFDGLFRNGKKHGLCKTFHLNSHWNDVASRLMRETNYDRGAKEGESRIYYPSGNLKIATWFMEGLEDGVRTRFRDEAGKVECTVLYHEGDPLGDEHNDALSDVDRVARTRDDIAVVRRADASDGAPGIQCSKWHPIQNPPSVPESTRS